MDRKRFGSGPSVYALVSLFFFCTPTLSRALSIVDDVARFYPLAMATIL